MASSTLQSSPWSHALPELLGRTLARLPLPADRARFRAVCRSWRSAVPPPPQMPWIVRWDGTFVTIPDGDQHRLPLPDNTSFIGTAADGWLALDRAIAGASKHERTYLLYNPFSNRTVPLPGLDSVIVKPSEFFEVRKALMRSTIDDLVAVTTNNRKYPLILCRPVKPGAWFPKPREMPCARIIDIVFHGGNLYGITWDDDLVVLELKEDGDGMPMAANVKYVIGHPSSNDDVAGPADGEELDDEEENDSEVSNDDDGEEVSSDDDEEESEGSEITSTQESEYDDASSVDEEFEDEDYVYNSDDNMVPDNVEDLNMGEIQETEDFIKNSRHLLVCNGKLLMVKRQSRTPAFSSAYNVKIEVLEADMEAGSWLPVAANGLPEAISLFISKRFCRSVSTFRGAEKFYFADEHDVHHVSLEDRYKVIDRKSSWFFPPEY